MHLLSEFLKWGRNRGDGRLSTSPLFHTEQVDNSWGKTYKGWPTSIELHMGYKRDELRLQMIDRGNRAISGATRISTRSPTRDRHVSPKRKSTLLREICVTTARIIRIVPSGKRSFRKLIGYACNRDLCSRPLGRSTRQTGKIFETAA